ncbi:uncharacterized protein [Malus domestica]|uniref:uncharacterized protein n=1 Tax=Malus domestica TaxID=3750 RepID=UPI003975EFFB
MASRKDKVVPATKAKNKNILAASGGTLSVTIRNKAKDLSAVPSTTTSTLPKEQEYPRHEPHDEKADPKVDPPKKETDEENEPLVEKTEEKLEIDQIHSWDLFIQSLQEMITSTIKAQYEGSSHDSVLYSKPYSKKIDALWMPSGYQPPKFMQFDGKGNPKQHIAHFIDTCNNAGTEEDYLVRQFVRSLKRNTFDWYTNLDLKSINSWDQLERQFLNYFYNTHSTVSMLELTSTK